eukprot:204236-Pyramimonas_sp.AAC.1
MSLATLNMVSARAFFKASSTGVPTARAAQPCRARVVRCRAEEGSEPVEAPPAPPPAPKCTLAALFMYMTNTP